MSNISIIGSGRSIMRRRCVRMNGRHGLYGAQELKRWQNAILRFAKIGVSRTNTMLFTFVSVHTFAKIGVSYPIWVVYIRILRVNVHCP